MLKEGYFSQREDGVGYCEEVPLTRIAEAVGTPVYIYSREYLRARCESLQTAFAARPPLHCFAVKANSNLTILSEIFKSGFGADVVSLGELERALVAGAKPQEIVYSGVGKRVDEMRRALAVGILTFNVESVFELEILNAVAKDVGKIAAICLRINPNIAASTNPKIATGLLSTKFGIAELEAKALIPLLNRYPYLELIGLACHIGSQITDVTPLLEAAGRLGDFVGEVRQNGIPLRFMNAGGGLGIRYHDEPLPALDRYAQHLMQAAKAVDVQLIIEPGRYLVGNMGLLLTKVLGVKKTSTKNFIVVDAAMNDLLRPSLYDAYHEIVAVRSYPKGHPNIQADVVGPVCETGDYLGFNRTLPVPASGDYLKIYSTGAYAASMASNYNSRPRAAEVLVDGSEFKIIRRREALACLWADELPLNT